jgi:hypothetical protein
VGVVLQICNPTLGAEAGGGRVQGQPGLQTKGREEGKKEGREEGRKAGKERKRERKKEKKKEGKERKGKDNLYWIKHISNRGLVFRIYKEVLQCNKKKTT